MNLYPRLLFALVTIAGCTVDPVTDEPVLEADEEALAAAERELVSRTVGIDREALVCESGDIAARTADELLCGGKCETIRHYKTTTGCGGLEGASLQKCLEDLCASAKKAHEESWPDGAPACPATNGACTSPLTPGVKGTCTNSGMVSWGPPDDWSVGNCSIRTTIDNQYEAKFGSFCPYKCIKDAPSGPGTPTPGTPTPGTPTPVPGGR